MSRAMPTRSFRKAVAAALEEDLGDAGDITTDSLLTDDQRSTGDVVARAGGRIAGLEGSLVTFELLDEESSWILLAGDGEDVEPGTRIAAVTASTRALLTGERTFLNFLGHLSGIATATREAVAAASGTNARIADTRKTTPGLRALEKYAVLVGGATNHRFGLYDAVMIKDNHIAATGSIAAAVAAARAAVGHVVKIEVEVESLEELEEALLTDADAVLLDNMGPEELAKGVAMVGGRLVTEASGGVTLERIADIAATGVDVISIGWLTHSAPRLDVALDIAPTSRST